MKIQDKKALRTATDQIAQAANTLRDATGVAVEARLLHESALRYDFDALGKPQREVLGRLGVVPSAILEALSTILQDADYKEAFEDVRTLEFVPTADGGDTGFDYGSSAALEGDMVRITYAPLSSMHGGYERAIKELF